MLSLALACALGFTAFSAALAPAAAATVSVVVNGRMISFDQPPIERAGRVFVPLRGVFEHLGASVVYANGIINATGNGRNISLRIGSTAATVNGQVQTLDVAPFLVGSRTLVPLRFVAQALGAAVDWNQSNFVVTITGAGGGGNVPPPNASFSLTNKRPATSTSTLSPAIHANFSEPIDGNSLRVYIDGNNVTNFVYENSNGFDLTPPAPLSSGAHRVRVSGTTSAGASFDTGWTFTASNGATQNFINNLRPTPGTRVGSNFTLAGRTLPNSTVHIVASGEVSALGILQIGTGTFQIDVQAGPLGNFSAPISLNAVNGGSVHVIIQSSSPSGASVERSITYPT
jgi:hypothetical protein